MLVVCVIRRRTRSIVVLFALCQEEAEQQHDSSYSECVTILIAAELRLVACPGQVEALRPATGSRGLSDLSIFWQSWFQGFGHV